VCFKHASLKRKLLYQTIEDHVDSKRLFAMTLVLPENLLKLGIMRIKG